MPRAVLLLMLTLCLAANAQVRRTSLPSFEMAVTPRTIGGPGLVDTANGAEHTVFTRVGFSAVSVCLTVVNRGERPALATVLHRLSGSGPEVVRRIEARSSRVMCIDEATQALLQCEGAGPGCRLYWRLDQGLYP